MLMLDGLTPDLAPRLVLAIGGVGVALVILVLVLIFLKRRNSPLFIKGGKSREPRLMVLDAAAVDPKRRLVLIRRDDVEHLIMIGGPTDIVIESGIFDRAKSAAPIRSAVASDIVTPQPAVTPVLETRPTPPVERRPEPARPAASVQPERPAAAPVEARAATPQPVVRPATPPVITPERTPPSVDRYMERPAAERPPEVRNVSAMGSVLYGEDREPMTGTKPAQPASEPARVQPVAKQPNPIEAVPAQPRVQPATSTAEAILDAARDRVLPPQQPAASPPVVTVNDAERALAARMEAMRRVQSAQSAVTNTSTSSVQSGAQSTPQSLSQRIEPQVEAAKANDTEPSDFEKLLEAELDANGVFGSQTPPVRTDSRVTSAASASAITPPVRVTPPITGATPDVTSEEEVARLLGEIAINRKP
jgi:hypothetical protein